jgi:hypothetical protein
MESSTPLYVTAIANRISFAKVGEVTDEACKLEAISLTLSVQLKELRAKTEKTEKAKSSIDASLREAMEKSDAGSPFGLIPATTDDLADTKEPDSQSDCEVDESIAPILETQSYEEQAVSILPSVVALKPSRSFQNLSMYSKDFGQAQPQAKRSKGFWSGFFTPAKESTRSSPAASRVSIPRESGPGAPEGGGAGQTPVNPVRIDFACGLSGHGGLSRRNPRNAPRRRVMSYSHRRSYTRTETVRFVHHYFSKAILQ